MQNTLDFDKNIICNVDDCCIEYGIVFGNTQKELLLVKAGQEGSARGYQDKYLKLAHRIHEKYGISVVCSSDPSSEINQMAHAMQILENEGLLVANTQVYFAGFSKGASIGCIQGTAFPQIVRYLLVNPPMMINTIKISRAAKNFNGEKMTFAFGSDDPSVGFADILRLHKRENLSVKIVPDQDHNLSRNNFDLTEFVEREVFFSKQ